MIAHVVQAADKEEEATGSIISEGDLFLNGAQSGVKSLGSEETVFHPSEFYADWTMEPATESLKQVLQHCTGWQNIPRPPEKPSQVA